MDVRDASGNPVALIVVGGVLQTSNGGAVSSPQLPATIGQKDAAHSMSVVLSSDGPFSTNFGLQADAVATTDTGSFSLIALFKRLLQGVTSMLGQRSYTITQTAITMDGTTKQLIAANAARKYLSWMVVGAGAVTVAPGAADAVAGVGRVYNGGGTALQGGAEDFPGGAPSNPFQTIGPVGAILYVWEGV